jgi:hypothetical protein
MVSTGFREVLLRAMKGVVGALAQVAVAVQAVRVWMVHLA